MILTAVWVGTWQLGVCITDNGVEEEPTLTTLFGFMAFDLLMASMAFLPGVWI